MEIIPMVYKYKKKEKTKYQNNTLFIYDNVPKF